MSIRKRSNLMHGRVKTLQKTVSFRRFVLALATALSPFAPVCAVRTADEGIRFAIADELLGLRVEDERAVQARGDVAEMAERRGEVAGEGIGIWLFAAADAVTEVGDV